jgi:hypothetical protein
MFHGWDNFYLMLGSAAASLIGLLFVVVTLTQGFDRDRAMKGVALYMTPTATHFAVVLVLSAAAVAPRIPLWAISAIVALTAVVGLFNGVRSTVAIAKMGKGDDPPHWTDLWSYGVGPLALYLVLFGVAASLIARVAWADSAVAVVLVALLLMGIRNAWDLITWMAPARNSNPSQPPSANPPPNS